MTVEQDNKVRKIALINHDNINSTNKIDKKKKIY